MTPRWPPLPRRLPRTLAPLRHETYASYLSRLAAANRVSFDDLDEIAHLDDDDPATVDQLAALTGHPASALLHAIPELFHHRAIDTTALASGCPTPKQFINDIRPPCRRCAAASGADPDIARVWATHDVNICVRHRLWIGDGNDQPAHQLDLRPCPDIVQAQIRHQRILRSRGRPAARAAFHAAHGLWANMSAAPGYTRQRDARTPCVCAQASATTAEEAVNNAATYPETVAFTAILASPCWRAIALSRKPADNCRFHHEFSHRVAPGHHENGYPRLLFWLRKDLERERDRDTDDTGPYPPAHPAPPTPSPRLAARRHRKAD
jgi:TniQ